MKRFILISLTLLLLVLPSCGRKSDKTVAQDSDKEQFNTDIVQQEQLYVVNVSTRSYHLPSCYIVNNIKEENKQETYDKNFLVERGYSPCKICIDKN